MDFRRQARCHSANDAVVPSAILLDMTSACLYSCLVLHMCIPETRALGLLPYSALEVGCGSAKSTMQICTP